MKPQIIAWVLPIVTGLLLLACVSRHSATTQTMASSAGPVSGRPATSWPPTNGLVRSFSARGVIRELPAAGRSLVVKHEDIPGFMPRMTMEFDLGPDHRPTGLRVGDSIEFQVHANETESWISDVRVVGTNSPVLPMPAGLSSAALLNAGSLKSGDLVADAELLSEDGRTIRLSSFRGRALALTFLFTRCPVPDFCPRMSQHFSRARSLLSQQAGGPTNWQFLSISFDPEVDKPGVLARYARGYRGQNQDRWVFAVASTNAMAVFGSQLDFRFANEGGSFVHNLRTVVIDARGRLFRQFNGNAWNAEELAQAIAEAARRSD